MVDLIGTIFVYPGDYRRTGVLQEKHVDGFVARVNSLSGVYR